MASQALSSYRRGDWTEGETKRKSKETKRERERPKQLAGRVVCEEEVRAIETSRPCIPACYDEVWRRETDLQVGNRGMQPKVGESKD